MPEKTPTLTLPCEIHKQDSLEVRRFLGQRAGVLVRQNAVSHTTEIVISQDNARALFNWLGVYLHTPRP